MNDAPSVVFRDVYDCNISSVPDEIGLLSQLQVLDLGINPLVRIPPSVGNLSELTTL